jgi:acetyltransferase-like isoleucine patch superfamily enzyme
MPPAKKAATARVGRGTRMGPGTVLQEWVEVGLNPAGKLPAPLLGRDCLLRSRTTVYRAVRIGDRFQTGHNALVREGTVVGNDVSLGTNSILERDAVVEDGVRIHSGCFLPEFTKVRKGAWIGPCVVVTNVLHPPCPQFKLQGKEGRDWCVDAPDIGPNAKIGAGAILMPGVRIGANALVGGGSIVVDDVPDGAVVAGNPARVVKTIPELVCHPGHYRQVYEWEARP